MTPDIAATDLELRRLVGEHCPTLLAFGDPTWQPLVAEWVFAYSRRYSKDRELTPDAPDIRQYIIGKLQIEEKGYR